MAKRGAKELGKTAYLATMVTPAESARVRAYAEAVDGNVSRILRRALVEFLDRRDGHPRVACAQEVQVPMT